MKRINVLVTKAYRDPVDPEKLVAEVLVDGVVQPLVISLREDQDGFGLTELHEVGDLLDEDIRCRRAVQRVLRRVSNGEKIDLPLDLSEEVESAPWPPRPRSDED